MHDIKNRRIFLKRTRFDEIRPELLYVGGSINIYSRHLKIVDYSDDYTRIKLGTQAERTCALVKPDGVANLGKILDAIAQSRLVVSQLRMCRLTKEEAQRFYVDHAHKPFFNKLTTFMSSDRMVAMELIGPGAIATWRELLGPTDTETARNDAPSSLRACFGTDGTANACHGSDSTTSAQQELSFFFSSGPLGKCCEAQNSTLGIVKPHVVKEGSAGMIIDKIQEKGLSIVAMQMFNLDKVNAAEFYEVYRGVVNPGEFSGMVSELMSGPCIAMEIMDPNGENVVEDFRELCGPSDPELARVLRPKSLRSLFGQAKVQNAIHCTDLEEDGELEVNYFFTILQE
ncbi:hypothetical protein BSKO_07779 [Bryopsis sp. KO-2023]|nr:hypothetical protein BSKO_07779 [Bryopsis sp. KO-2023]